MGARIHDDVAAVENYFDVRVVGAERAQRQDEQLDEREQYEGDEAATRSHTLYICVLAAAAAAQRRKLFCPSSGSIATLARARVVVCERRERWPIGVLQPSVVLIAILHGNFRLSSVKFGWLLHR